MRLRGVGWGDEQHGKTGGQSVRCDQILRSCVDQARELGLYPENSGEPSKTFQPRSSFCHVFPYILCFPRMAFILLGIDAFGLYVVVALHGVRSGCGELAWGAVVMTQVAGDGGQPEHSDICLTGDLVDWPRRLWRGGVRVH